ncbi:MAG: 2-dehydro-3-deoxygalactonokinase [Sphingomonadales bacterium]
MAGPLFIAGDWGTSNMRLCLMADGQVRDQVTGPGIGQAAQGPAVAFAAATQAWRQAHGPLPVLLCGMVGSSVGWVETPYLPCPAGFDELDQALTRFEASGHPVAIVPGLTALNPLASTDFMRGEETQIFGAMASRPELRHGRHFLCLPGTHSKWVLVEDGKVRSFMTALAGELFAVLRQHSVLCRGAEIAEPMDGAAFAAGLTRTRQAGGQMLLQQLFETRARQLTGEFSKQAAVSFLSGLVIGHDVAGGLAAFAAQLGAQPQVTVIGAATLLGLYDQAFRAHGIETVLLDGMTQSLAGLSGIAAAVELGATAGA